MDDNDATLANIMARLTRVERKNRRLQQTALILFVVLGIVLLMGQTRPNRTVEAEQFVLKDAKGITRARLEMEFGDRPTLVLLDAKGFPTVSLGAGGTPFLSLCKGNCEQQAQIVVTQDLVGLALYEGGKGWNPAKEDQGELKGLKAGFGVIKGVPGLNLFNKDATEQASLDLETGPRLVLNDADGNVSLGKGIIIISDPKGNASLGQGSIGVGDAQGFRTIIGTTDLVTPRTGETHKTSAASIVLFGKDNKALWSAP